MMGKQPTSKLTLNYMQTLPTHHYLQSSERAAYLKTQGHSTHEPVTNTLHALPLVGNVDKVQVRFTLPLEGPTKYVNARWM
jgi:hypothetical protein